MRGRYQKNRSVRIKSSDYQAQFQSGSVRQIIVSEYYIKLLGCGLAKPSGFTMLWGYVVFRKNRGNQSTCIFVIINTEQTLSCRHRAETFSRSGWLIRGGGVTTQTG